MSSTVTIASLHAAEEWDADDAARRVMTPHPSSSTVAAAPGPRERGRKKARSTRASCRIGRVGGRRTCAYANE
ncbi:hypothetical protein [Burkholderia vietnamiensis]|uniref:hypothetical protein n=1 Tax=Burkholderia vietnamiensis TaxID=60552 RepID=UPI003D1601D0